MEKGFVIKKVEDEKERSDVLEIRKKVFIEEQKIPDWIEYDGLDGSCTHVAAYAGTLPVGCARIRNVEGDEKIERLAVLKEFRNYGIGRKILEYAIELSIEKQPNEIFLHAQYQTKDFYEKCGFVSRGQIFKEAGIPHIEMFLKK